MNRPSCSADPPAAALVAELARALGAQLVETHISWVLLAGDFAWKLKKPVRFGPLDYTTLAARRHFCEEEVRINRAFAGPVYLGVVPVTLSPAGARFGGAGEPVEYAVHMRRFPPGALISERVDAHTLTPAEVDALADKLAAFHGAAAVAPAASDFGLPQRRAGAALAALSGAASVAHGHEGTWLRDWIAAEAARLHPLWTERRQRGFVRECHGDLHLANLLILDGQVLAFDAIEFDDELRWIDIVDDLAFAVMDFAARGRRDFAFRLLDRWLDASGDHGGVASLRFALVYRALVRAQVELARGRGPQARRLFEQALGWSRPAASTLTLTHGLPGSGKTFESQRLLEREGVLRLRSDVERKRLFGLDMLDDSRRRGLDIYGPDASRRTYAALFHTAAAWLREGWPVILDAAFLRRDERDAARAVARAAGVPLRILHCEAPDELLRRRLAARRGDASEADEAVLERLRAAAQPLAADELADVLRPTSAA